MTAAATDIVWALKQAEADALGQGLSLNDLEAMAHNEMMLANTLTKAERYHEAAFWASAYADAMGRLAEAHDGDPAWREIICHGDWIEQRRTDMRLAIRKDERRKPNSETATIRNCRTNLLECAK